MLIHPYIASQLASQRQREMVAQASEHRLRRQLRAQSARLPAADTAARPHRSWRARAWAVLRIPSAARPFAGPPADPAGMRLSGPAAGGRRTHITTAD